MTRIFSLLLVITLMFSSLALPVSAATSYATGQYTVSHANGVNVRSSANTSSKVLGAAAKGVTFTVTKISGSWGYTSSIKTATGTKSGWVSLSYCTGITGGPASTITTTQGSGTHVTGTITSTGSKIKTITAKVMNSAGTKQITSLPTKSVTVNAYSYVLKDSAIDTAMTFGKLSAGTYKLKITVTTADKSTRTFTSTVTVKAKSSTTVAASAKGNTSITGSKYMKPYTGSNYANYYVVKGYDDAYCYNQYNYSRFIVNGTNKGCTATANATALSIKQGRAVSPNSIGWSSAGCVWKSVSSVKSSTGKTSGYGKQTQLNLIAQELVKGNAVIVRANSYHTVTAIGLKSTANLSSITASDILIIDPAGGTVKTLDKAGHGGYVYQSDWSLLIAK
jgi:hypothetical protein